MLLNRKQRRAQEALNRQGKGIQMARRNKEAINQEYAQVCAQIGERVFQIEMMQRDVDLLKGRVLELGKEIKVIQDAEQAAPASAATAQPLTEVPNVSPTPVA